MIKITQKHKECIGCGTCSSLCPKFWELKESDQKSHLKGGKFDKTKEEYTLEVKNATKKDLDCNKLAAESCPVQIIKIEE